MPKTIALISEHASPLAVIGGVDAGGQNIAVAELATSLAQLGYNIDVFTRCTSASEPDVVQWQPAVRVIHILAGPRQYLLKEALLPYINEFASNMAAYIQQQGLSYRLLHAHFFMLGLVAMILKQQLKISFVSTFHALGFVRRLLQGADDGSPVERIAIEKRIVQEADGIIALCPQDSLDLITLYGASPAKTTIIPNGYNPTDFFPVEKADARQHLGLDQQIPLLLQLDWLVPRKGIANVIRALALLHQKHNIPAQLLIVGGYSRCPDPTITPEIDRLQRLADTMGIPDYVTFTGSRERHKLRYYYGTADVFITTPTYELFGITPFEAMACGTPVVGSVVGSISHTVLLNRTGFLGPPNDPASSAAHLKAFPASESLRKRYSQAAVQHVQTGYTWERVAHQTSELYDLLVNGHIRTAIGLGAAHYSPPALYQSGKRHE